MGNSKSSRRSNSMHSHASYVDPRQHTHYVDYSARGHPSAPPQYSVNP